MKAIKINKPGEIYVSEIPDAKWKKGYAVIEVKALGVCGSDVHAYAGKSPNVSYPLVIGHETAGIVVEVEDENRYGIKKEYENCSEKCGRFVTFDHQSYQLRTYRSLFP